MPSRAIHSAQYLSSGFRLISRPGIRGYVFIPLLLNLVLLGVATYTAFVQLDAWFNNLQNSDSSVIQWFVTHLGWLIWPVVVVLVLVTVFYLFAILANWIAAPFNGLLSEAVEKHLSGTDFQNNEGGFKQFIADMPRLFGREWRKMAYYLPRAILCLVLFWTPLVIAAPFIWFAFNAWMTGIQYLDYPMDNHKGSFQETLSRVKRRRGTTMGFGGLVLLLTSIPLVNLLVMPAAVAGATHLWFDHLRES